MHLKKKKQKSGRRSADRRNKHEKKSEVRPIQNSQNKSKNVVGELSLHRDGYGFVCPADGSPDIFIPARYVGSAFHTDVVEATITADGRKGPEGRIVNILERKVEKLLGRFELKGKVFQVVADDRRVRHRISIHNTKTAGAKNGDTVVVKITAFPKGDDLLQGEVLEVLGKRGEVETERSAVVVRHQLRSEFSKLVMTEAEGSAFSLAREGQNDKSRKDLRDISFVTIDGETARDFDDAVAVQKHGDVLKLFVSIADVSWFVRTSSVVDKEAYERSTSVYFPDHCIPMLPEILSNEFCSLKPDEDRLCFTAEMDVSPDGQMIQSSFYKSIIRSKRRLTYNQVHKALVLQDTKVIKDLAPIMDDLHLLRDCFKRLLMSRRARGSLDFDLPEPQILIDLTGSISDIVRAERHEAHMMIEEFMILANESVAKFMSDRKFPNMYRIHEPPPTDKLYEFSILIHNLGESFDPKKDATPKALSKLLQKFKGRPEERLVNHMLLRSLSQAVYSEKNVGHFGLGLKHYCHFTSPIRRYPDLVVHRLLASALKGEQRPVGNAKKSTRVHDMAEHCSRRERIAMEAEREINKLYCALFMESKIGEEFLGVVSHVTKFGFFVELVDFFVEGLVHVDSLMEDNYRYEESQMCLCGKKGKKIKIGDKVKIEVGDVNVPARELNFILIEKVEIDQR